MENSISSALNLDDEMPALETANEMRRILASDPVAQAKFFNLMMQLFFTHILGIFRAFAT